MAQVIDTIIQSSIAPKKTNVLWDDGVSIKRFKDGKWQPIGGGEGGSIDPETIEGFIPLSRDFSDDFNNDFTR